MYVRAEEVKDKKSRAVAAKAEKDQVNAAIGFVDNRIQSSISLMQGAGSNLSASNATNPIQRAPWQNAPAKFRTDNGLPGIPNSEYLVYADGYKRYAPVNAVRAPGQEYHEGPRNFAYVNTGEAEDVAVRKTKRVTMTSDGKVRLRNGLNSVIAERVPQNGLTVWDTKVNDEGWLEDWIHVGHSVEDLGKQLPNLDSAGKTEDAKLKQEYLLKRQEAGLLEADNEIMNQVYDFSDRECAGDDEVAFSRWTKETDLGKRLRATKNWGKIYAKIKRGRV